MITVRGRRWLRPALVAMAAGAVLTFPAPEARAAEGVSLSLDGRHWGSTVDTPLWDPGVRWVPGDSRSVSVWVRNDSGISSTLRVEVVAWGRASADVDLADDLTATARVDGTETEVHDDLVPVPAPPPRRQQRVELTMTFPVSAGNRTQSDVSATRIRITLTERPGRDGTALPGTGGPPTAVAGAGVVAILAGVVLARARRSHPGGSS